MSGVAELIYKCVELVKEEFPEMSSTELFDRVHIQLEKKKPEDVEVMYEPDLYDFLVDGILTRLETEEKIRKHGIKKISNEMYKEIIESLNESTFKYEKHQGLYYFKINSKWIVIDNTTRDCWVEETKDFDKGVAWLVGEIDAEELYEVEEV